MGSGVALRQRAWQLQTAPARTEACGRRIVLSGPIFSRTRGDGRAPPHSANEGATGGDTEADRRVPPATFSDLIKPQNWFLTREKIARLGGKIWKNS
jgi:hypothetical protein